ncbi:MAG: hypothetical protein GX880_08060 [Methanomicrobiales archaeon]|nr:hypothetical protein [Methanomicrobiales archaeon]
MHARHRILIPHGRVYISGRPAPYLRESPRALPPSTLEEVMPVRKESRAPLVSRVA